MMQMRLFSSAADLGLSRNPQVNVSHSNPVLRGRCVPGVGRYEASKYSFNK